MSEQNQENEQEDIKVEENEKEIKPRKIPFFKKVWYSIVKFEKYVEMSLEGTSRAIKYLLQIVSIFVLIIASLGLHSANKGLNSFIKNIEENVPDFKYADGQIALADGQENKLYVIDDANMNFGKVIIDLNTEDENEIAEYENTIKTSSETNNVGFIILKNKVMQVAHLEEGVEGESTISLSYDQIMQNLFGSSEVQLTKSDLVKFLDGNGRTSILIVNFFSYFIAYFIIYITSGLIYVLVLALIGYTSVKIAKIKLTFSQLFSMSVYAFTLSNVLNMIYFVLNYFAGITIKYFDVAYIALAYIYLITVIFLIKTDFLRKQENTIKKEEEKRDTDGQEQI